MEYAIRLRDEGISLSQEAKSELLDVTNTVDLLFEASIKTFDERDTAMLATVDVLEESIDQANIDLEAKHIDRLKKGLCTPQIGSIYLQTISNLERVGDHITNIAFSIKQYEK